jgi:hypothetical protein
LYRRPSVTGYDWGYPDLCILSLLKDIALSSRYTFGVLVVQWFVVIGLAIAVTVITAKRTSWAANNVI